jgi:hypothetical protein
VGPERPESGPEILQRARRSPDPATEPRAAIDDIEAPHRLPGRVAAHAVVRAQLPVGREPIGELPVAEPNPQIGQDGRPQPRRRLAIAEIAVFFVHLEATLPALDNTFGKGTLPT